MLSSDPEAHLESLSLEPHAAPIELGLNLERAIYRMVKWVYCSVAVVALLLGVRAFVPPVPDHLLSAVQPGMSPSQVIHLLGPPTRQYANGQWTYTRPLTFGYVNVLFTTNGTVLHAHREEF